MKFLFVISFVLTLLSSVKADVWSSGPSTSAPTSNIATSAPTSISSGICDGSYKVYGPLNIGNSVFSMCTKSSATWLYKDNALISGYTQDIQPLWSTFDFLTGYVSGNVYQTVGTNCFNLIGYNLISDLIPSTSLDDAELQNYLSRTFIKGSTNTYRGEPSLGFITQGTFITYGLTPDASANLVLKRRGYFVSCDLTEGNTRFWAVVSYVVPMALTEIMTDVGILAVALGPTVIGVGLIGLLVIFIIDKCK